MLQCGHKIIIFLMTSFEKLLKKFLHKPSSVRYSQIKKMLIRLGFVEVPAKGSHIKFKHSQLSNDLVIPIHGRECKDFYKKMIAKIIKDII